MSLTSFEGWDITKDNDRLKIRANFKEAGSNATASYSYGMLREKFGHANGQDKVLIGEALKQSPHVFDSFIGWQDRGRKGHDIWLAAFKLHSGSKSAYNPSTLEEMLVSKASGHSAFDKRLIQAAIDSNPSNPKPQSASDAPAFGKLDR